MCAQRRWRGRYSGVGSRTVRADKTDAYYVSRLTAQTCRDTPPGSSLGSGMGSGVGSVRFDLISHRGLQGSTNEKTPFSEIQTGSFMTICENRHETRDMQR